MTSEISAQATATLGDEQSADGTDWTMDPEGQALGTVLRQHLLDGPEPVARRVIVGIKPFVEVSDGDKCVKWPLVQFLEGKGHEIGWDQREGCDAFD